MAKKFDYTTRTFHVEDRNHMLKEYGEAGWEFVTEHYGPPNVADVATAGASDHTVTMTFKRERYL